jgi:hypothetical protein
LRVDRARAGAPAPGTVTRSPRCRPWRRDADPFAHDVLHPDGGGPVVAIRALPAAIPETLAATPDMPILWCWSSARQQALRRCAREVEDRIAVDGAWVSRPRSSGRLPCESERPSSCGAVASALLLSPDGRRPRAGCLAAEIDEFQEPMPSSASHLRCAGCRCRTERVVHRVRTPTRAGANPLGAARPGWGGHSRSTGHAAAADRTDEGVRAERRRTGSEGDRQRHHDDDTGSGTNAHHERADEPNQRNRSSLHDARPDLRRSHHLTFFTRPTARSPRRLDGPPTGSPHPHSPPVFCCPWTRCRRPAPGPPAPAWPDPPRFTWTVEEAKETPDRGAAACCTQGRNP